MNPSQLHHDNLAINFSCNDHVNTWVTQYYVFTAAQEDTYKTDLDNRTENQNNIYSIPLKIYKKYNFAIRHYNQPRKASLIVDFIELLKR